MSAIVAGKYGSEKSITRSAGTIRTELRQYPVFTALVNPMTKTTAQTITIPRIRPNTAPIARSSKLIEAAAKIRA